ncbi:MAG: hypothetical protein ACSNEK_01330 [Parachlamydiaceae bacterium]
MVENRFTIKEVLGVGWEGWKAHWPKWVAIIAITVFLTALPNVIESLLGMGFFSSLLQLAAILLGPYASLGITNVTLKIVQKEQVELVDFFDTFPYFVRFLLGQVLYYLGVCLGFFLFIIPGVIFGLKFYLYPYFIIEKNFGVIESFKASNKVVYGSKEKLCWFTIIAYLLNALGALCLLFGLFVTVPVIAIAQAAIYKILTSQEEALPLVAQSE